MIDRLVHRAGRCLDAVDGAGEQGADHLHVAWNLHEFDVDAVFLKKSLFLGHVEESGVALERNDALTPLGQGP